MSGRPRVSVGAHFGEVVLKEIVAAQDLRLGMFVSELDRPWLESPFLLQGFLVEDEQMLAQLRDVCRFVYVDRARSTGDAWRAPTPDPQADAPPERVATMSSFQVPADTRRRPMNFFAMLRALRGTSVGQPDAVLDGAGGGAAAPWLRIYADAQPARGGSVEEARPNDYSAAAAAGRPLITATSAPGRRGGGMRRDAPDEALRGGPGSPVGLVYSEPTMPVEEEIVAALPLVDKAQTLLAQIAEDVQRSLNPDLERLRGVVSEMVLSVARNPDALLWLARLCQTDQYSYDHSLDVSAHVMIFGRYLGLGDESITALGMAGMLQDVGKLRLPVRLLQKTGPVSPTEFEIFKTHVAYSLQVLADSPHASPLILEIVARHHERYDGSGYPRGLKGEQIGLMSEIAGICDMYCAMTRERPYGAAASSQAALDAVRAQRGSSFSESTVDQFVQCIGLYPVGTLVELNTGEVAVVVAQNRIRRLKPRVMILLGPDKKPNPYPHTLDLLYDQSSTNDEPYAIVRALPPGAYGVEPSEFYLA